MTKAERERANAYKVGFLRKLAQLGVLPGEFHKRASGLGVLGLANLAGSGMSLAGQAGKTGIETALMAPLLAGTATGALSGLSDAPSAEDIEILRQKEKLELLRRLTKEVKLRKALHEEGQYK
jgi:hypothetical protein